MVDYFFSAFSIFIFLFFFWRRLKEDYSPERIFSLAFSLLLALAISSLIAKLYLPRIWFWANITAVFLILTIGIIRYRFRFFEVFEAVVVSLLPWYSLIFIKEAILSKNLYYLAACLVIFLLMSIFSYFDHHYKSISWYTSGKIGFSGLSVLTIFFLIRTAVAVLRPGMLSFVGREDVIISGFLAGLSFITLIILSRSGS